MSKRIVTASLLVLLVSIAVPVLADTDASVSQVYEAARTGHIAQAEQMISQVLRDYPGSAKAHYVAAEVYARAGDYPTARRELSAAQRLSPALPFVRPESAAALQRELTRGTPPALYGATREHGASIPWGLILLIVAGIAIVWAFARRRQGYAYSPYQNTLPSTGMPGAAPLGGPVIGGGGSGLMGSLASGLAVGAGVAAGEELVRHVMGGDRTAGGVFPTAEAGELPDNQDLGGSDFGITGGGGWDDGGGGSFGGDVGGNDWT